MSLNVNSKVHYDYNNKKSGYIRLTLCGMTCMKCYVMTCYEN